MNSTIHEYVYRIRVVATRELVQKNTTINKIAFCTIFDIIISILQFIILSGSALVRVFQRANVIVFVLRFYETSVPLTEQRRESTKISNQKLINEQSQQQQQQIAEYRIAKDDF